jgi:hypothetical protein
MTIQYIAWVLQSGTAGQAADDNTIERMGIARWTIEAVYSEYVIVTALSRYQWLREWASRFALIHTLPLLFSPQFLCNLGWEKWTNIILLFILSLHMDLMHNINTFMTSGKVTISCVEDSSYIAGK